MQPRHRRGQAQAEAGTGLRPALLQPHEALDHAAAVGFRDARAMIGDREQDAIAGTERADHDFRRRAVGAAWRRGVFDGVVDQTPMSWAISAASNSFMSSRACPDSARAIINSALNVVISASDSSIVDSSAARYSASLLEERSACSARLRSRVSGVFKS